MEVCYFLHNSILARVNGSLGTGLQRRSCVLLPLARVYFCTSILLLLGLYFVDSLRSRPEILSYLLLYLFHFTTGGAF